jgi:hypothetical protein
MRRYSEILRQSPDFRHELMSLLVEDFRFLESDFGLARRDLTDGYSYSGEATVVYVRLWEESWVGIDRIINPYGQSEFGLPIWAVMNARASKHLCNEANNSLDKFPVYAAALRECCSDLLAGDFSNIRAIVDWLSHRAAKQEMWEKRMLPGERGDA